MCSVFFYKILLLSTDEQKIIYSGQLLDDNAILKDVLRTYESQIAHIMHLVCTPKRRMAETNDNEGMRRRNVTVNSDNPPSGQSEAVRPEVTRPETRQNDQNHTVEMQNYLTSFVNNYGRVPQYPNYNLGGDGYLPVTSDPASMANHMMMMQQAYLQYMQQYANMWQAGAAPPAPPAEAPPPAPPAPPRDADGDDGLARDWLDHLYAASRLAILFSLVYLYGSPVRLLLVLLLAAAGYLHQIGFFRDLHVNPPQVQPERRNERPENQNQNQPEQNRNRIQAEENRNQPEQNRNQPEENRNQPERNRNQNQPSQNQNQEIPEQRDNVNNQSLLAVTWMIFTSFFSSLIPDTN
ncbi:homocysteine-responsive endoplasmic reticulum-resident ubiquitin-like domain member 2 protein isoform X2 [Amyelois transitella]|uniref:homocysteine-responsive endoplasmic reticulum-resident ubiquitin-like domain member 2 protein isoform X2 n=1 Tax=Amyelois transitella TaxID=680683 RepID=UPI0029903ED1|nr:homocysteine-responsive endoplasmic reticulum-resident ubiquitin-like domain member 2 protein isoform X2 [Amyelois transitella]